MEIILCTYTNQNKVYRERQTYLDSKATSFGFTKSLCYTEEWLKNTQLYLQHRSILNQVRGAGYWLWKPYIILDALKKAADGDVVLYLDSGDDFNFGIVEFLKSYFKEQDMLLTIGGRPNTMYTKRDCFIRMNADFEYYWKLPQLEAGVIALKKTDRNRSFVLDWLDYCLDARIITDIPNEIGSNFEDFIDHRHDQSILTNLAGKYGFVGTNEVRKYITCNV